MTVREIVAEEDAVARGLPGLADDPRRRRGPLPDRRAAGAELPRSTGCRRPLLPHAGSRRAAGGARAGRGVAPASTFGACAPAGRRRPCGPCDWTLCAAGRSGCGVRRWPRGRPRADADGDAGEATATSTPTPTGPWRSATRRARPLRCPASSSRAGWPSRVLALGGNRYAKLWGRRPRLAAVDARGHLLGQQELGARRITRARARVRAGRAHRRRVDGVPRPRPRGLAPLPVGRPCTDHRHRPRAVLRPGHPGRRARVRSRRVAADRLLGGPCGARRRGVACRRGRRPVRARAGVDRSRCSRPRSPATGGRSWPGRRSTGARNATSTAGSTPSPGATGGSARRSSSTARRHLSFQASSYGPIRLAVAANGRALLLWGTDSRAEFPESWVLRTAEAPPDGPFGASRQVVVERDPAAMWRSAATAAACWSGPTPPACARASGAGAEVVVDGRTATRGPSRSAPGNRMSSGAARRRRAR